ncbi:hypothetical protein N9L44_06135 [Porticoccaceae bacterium]|nr:hypothetical protein [Porticoccaceae bacterium]MDA7769071.1 hypothetical protein [Porticoccaceae bacterium]MDA8598442.1 hypothetical protein [Porticoccaceae bacterium]MDA8878645.1 hypothetical protein [Porticoccaceae bacterium]MDA8941361.1 hypothetical protein [Porticoccaceae bacterium]
MRVLAEFIMRGRMQACLVGVFGSLLPFVSVSTIGLVTLRKGAAEGFIVSLWVILPLLLSYMFSASSPFMAVVSGVALINMALVANAHRVTADWNFSLGIATLSGVVLVCLAGLLFQAEMNDFVNELEEMLATASEQSGQTMLVLTRNGFLAFVAWVVIFNTVIGLVLSRWWQALLYNPGGFQEEFQMLRLSPKLSLVCLSIFIAGLALGGNYQLWLRLASIPLLIGGLAIVHYVVQHKGFGRQVLVVMYVGLFLFGPVLMVLLGALGAADSVMNFRTRLADDKQS